MAGRVVLLHGIARRARSMAPLAAFLQQEGFETLNLQYPSTRYPLEELAEWLYRTLREQKWDTAPCHFVCHSMGGLVVRAVAQHYPDLPIGRVVMLGTPNQGSALADMLCRLPLYHYVYGPAGQELVTHPEGTCHQLGPVPFETGVIAGTWTIDPLGWLLLPKPNDGKVPVACTQVEGMADHLTLPVTHALMMRNPKVMEQVVYFLRHGRFVH